MIMFEIKHIHLLNALFSLIILSLELHIIMAATHT